MDSTQAKILLTDLLKKLIQNDGSDLFISEGFPPAIKVDGILKPLSEQPLSAEQASALTSATMNDAQLAEFQAKQECNFAIAPAGIGRFRVNAFMQRGKAGAVLRVITTDIPSLESLQLPKVMADVAMSKRGLVLVVGGTGSGKSTTMAGLIDHRNQNTQGHIITIEDPVEYVHPHKGCLVTQREVGVDTENWAVALKNTLRQAPDVILIGEVRDRETMEYALQFAETGHLCLATLHANSANQAMDRVINFFPEEKREQLLMDMSLNLRGILSQRLVPKVDGGRACAMEVLLNTPRVADLIFKGDTPGLKAAMQNGAQAGMQTFDQHLFQLYSRGEISAEEALRHADSKNELRIAIKQKGQRDGLVPDDTGLSLEEIPEDRADNGGSLFG